MTNYDKMAIQFECCGDVFEIPEIEEKLTACVEQGISRAARSGRVTRALGACMSGAPAAMKRLASIETGKTVAEIEELSLNEMSVVMAKVFSRYILPFFGSGVKQDGAK